MQSFLLVTLASALLQKDTETAEASKALQRTMAKALALGVECEEMCKAVGAYPKTCACPGWNGMPASSNDMDTRGCYEKYCVPIAHTADPCPSDAFVTCVAENSKVAAFLQVDAQGKTVDWSARVWRTQAALASMEKKQKRLMADTVALGVQCEEMCKKMGQFPQGCQCPGWNGTPGSSDELDGRDCYTKYCVPIAHTSDPCPSDDFVTCVSENTKHSFMQVNWLAKKQAIQAAGRAMAVAQKSKQPHA